MSKHKDSLIEVKDLAVHFPFKTRTLFKTEVQMLRAVDGASFDIKRGERPGNDHLPL